MLKSFDKTCIDDKELTVEIKILQLIEKQDGMVLASATLAFSDYFDPQVVSLLQPQKDDQQKHNLSNFVYFVSYKLLLIVLSFTKTCRFTKIVFPIATCLLRVANFDKFQ